MVREEIGFWWTSAQQHHCVAVQKPMWMHSILHSSRTVTVFCQRRASQGLTESREPAKTRLMRSNPKCPEQNQ
jgi:hypothetical protein